MVLLARIHHLAPSPRPLHRFASPWSSKPMNSGTAFFPFPFYSTLVAQLIGYLRLFVLAKLATSSRRVKGMYFGAGICEGMGFRYD